MGERDRHQDRLLLAGRAFGRRQVEIEMAHREVAAMRPAGCGAGLGVAQAAGSQLAAQTILGVDGGHGRDPAIDLAGHGECGARERPDAQPRRRIEAMDGVGTRRGQGHAVAGHGVLERGEPVRIAAAVGQQAGALAQRVLVGGDVAGMLGMQRRHQPVEEAPALAGPVEKQPVELRRQPNGRDMQAERRLALRRPAVDAHGAPQAALAAGGLQSGTDGEPPLRRVERGGNRPAAGLRLAAARATGDLVHPGPAQAAAGRQEGQGLEQVGLAGTVGAHQHDGRGAAIEAELAVVPEVGQPELAHGQYGRRCAGCGVGGMGECADRRRRHTRIGISTYSALSSAPSRTRVGEPASAIRKRASEPAICSVMSSR